MRAKNIDLNLLTALDALLAERNVTRAGRRLGRSQPAMSEALARLRRHFGDPLLVRAGNRYDLTPLGASLRAPTTAALELVERTFSATRDFDPTTCEREFTLLASDYPAALLARELAGAIGREAPRARLRLGRLPADPPPGGIGATARRVDGVLPHAGTNGEGLPGINLFSDRWICLAASDGPVPPGPPSPAALAGLPWVVHQAMRRDNPVLAALRAHGVPPRIDLVVDEYHLLPELVRDSDRLCVVPERLLAGSAARSGLRVLTLPFAVPPVVQEFRWDPAHAADPSHRWLRGLVAAAGRRVCAATGGGPIEPLPAEDGAVGTHRGPPRARN